MDFETDSVCGGSTNILPQEGKMVPTKIEAYMGATSTIRLSDIEYEEKDLATLSKNKFYEEQFFADPILNMNGGQGLCLTNKNEEVKLEINSKFMKHLKPDMDALSDVQDFTEFRAKSDSSITSFVKPIEDTDQLVKLKCGQTPFYDSRRDIIAQKPLNRVKYTGRMSFELADMSLIENKSKLKVFLRDISASDFKILELHGKKVEDKNKCLCFAEHNNSLFCLQSRYEDKVKVTWSEDKSFVFINVDDVKKFELLFAPLILHSKLKNQSSLVMQLVFQMETEMDVLEQCYYIKFLMSPKRDIDHFIKTLVKQGYVDKSYLEEITDLCGSFDILKVEFDAKYDEEFKQFLASIGGEIIFQ